MRRHERGGDLIAALAAVAAMFPGRAGAQLFPGVDEWAQSVAADMAASEQGPRVPAPEPVARPSMPGTLASVWWPVAVHFPRASFEPIAVRALRELERAAAVIADAGWAAPYPDGGIGGTPSFDLYLDAGADTLADAFVDGPVFWSESDAATTFGVVEAGVGSDLPACVFSAYVQAVLLGLEPAEARAWRRATAEWAARAMGGTLGCGDGVAQQQREPWRGWISGAADDGAGGALFIGMLSERHDGGSGNFIRDLWQIARQSSHDVNNLRARPDLWETLHEAFRLAGDNLRGLVEEMAVARWFAGTAERSRFAPFEILRSMGSPAAVSPFDRIEYAELPEHGEITDPPLEPFGSAYTLISLEGAPRDGQLRLWLEGEYGVYWSFVAVRLGADGCDRGRLRAPPRTHGRGYLIVELLEGTASVLVVVTNLSSRLPDADRPDENIRAARVIVGTTLPVGVDRDTGG